MNVNLSQSCSPARVEGKSDSEHSRFVFCPHHLFNGPIDPRTCRGCPKQVKCKVWSTECPIDGLRVTILCCSKCPEFSKCRTASVDRAEALQKATRPLTRNEQRKGVSTILGEHAQWSLHIERAKKLRGHANQSKRSRSRYRFVVKN